MLTALAIRKLEPKEKEYTKKIVPGLFIRVKANGTKIFVIKKKVKGKLFSKSLGTFPNISIADAKIELDKITALYSLPVEAQSTFEQVFQCWLDLKRTKLSSSSIQKIERAFKKILIPTFGKLPIALVTTPKLIDAIKPFSDRAESTQKICGWLKQMELYAVNYGIIDACRWQGINKVFALPKIQNMPAFHPSDLPSFFIKMMKETSTSTFVLDALMIGFYTLLRPGEYTQLKWEWIHGDVIYIPAEVMKMKRSHRVPISKQLQNILDNRLKISEYVLFSPRNPQKHVLPDTIEKFLRTHGFRGVLVPHGIRSIGRTWMTEHRVPFDVAEACLAHSVGSQTVQAYDRSDLLEERRKVMQEWCDFVDACRQ